MKTKAVIFTCVKHLEAAKIAAEVASRNLDVVLAFDSSEKGASVPDGSIWTNFPRGGNLNGFDAARGVATTMLSLCDSGHVIKIDSDTIIKDASMFLDFDIAGFPQPHYAPALYGCCYSVSRRALEHAIACIDKAVNRGIKVFPEDTIITGYAQTLHKDDFKENIVPLKYLGAWHPEKAPKIKSRIGNFGIYRLNGNWCHEQSIAAMREYANS